MSTDPRDLRWLVVGANGMLGTELMRLLDGRNVTGVDLPAIDITDPASVETVLADVDVVVNCAAYTAVDDAETNEAIAFRVNAVGPAILARRCNEIGAKLVQISTDYVFDGTAPDPYQEGAQPNPQSAYGRTKLAGEWAVRAELPGELLDPAHCLAVRRIWSELRQDDGGPRGQSSGALGRRRSARTTDLGAAPGTANHRCGRCGRSFRDLPRNFIGNHHVVRLHSSHF
ncbi:MAG: NAD(P)-dependent oxidoreductase [Candidatus Nanopelagicales bacterium]